MGRITKENFQVNSVCTGCREFSLHWLYKTSRNFVIRLTSLRRHDDVKLKKKSMSASFCVVLNATFKIKHSKSKDMQEKESNMSVQWGLKILSLEITVLHHSAEPGDAKQCLGTEFSIRTSHPCKILIIFHAQN